MNPIFQQSIYPPIAGFIIIGYNNIREVSIVELRNKNIAPIDSSHMFYRVKMLGFTEENDFSLRRYYRIQQIAKRYVTYSIGYSLSSKEEIETKILSSEYSNHIIFYCNDLIGKIRLLDLRLMHSTVFNDICSKEKLLKEIKYESYSEYVR